MSERIRFQADANFNGLTIKGSLRRQPLIDFQTAEAAALTGVPDPDVLARTAQSGRILVSHDFHTMLTHFADFLARGQHSPGVMLIPQTLPLVQAIDALPLVWDASEPDEWRDTLTYLPLWLLFYNEIGGLLAKPIFSVYFGELGLV